MATTSLLDLCVLSLCVLKGVVPSFPSPQHGDTVINTLSGLLHMHNNLLRQPCVWRQHLLFLLPGLDLGKAQKRPFRIHLWLATPAVSSSLLVSLSQPAMATLVFVIHSLHDDYKKRLAIQVQPHLSPAHHYPGCPVTFTVMSKHCSPWSHCLALPLSSSSVPLLPYIS